MQATDIPLGTNGPDGLSSGMPGKNDEATKGFMPSFTCAFRRSLVRPRKSHASLRVARSSIPHMRIISLSMFQRHGSSGFFVPEASLGYVSVCLPTSPERCPKWKSSTSTRAARGATWTSMPCEATKLKSLMSSSCFASRYG